MGGPIDPREFEAGAGAVRRFVDYAAAHYPIDRRKLVVMGFSQGGVMAYDLVLRDPARFAGLVALSSWLPGTLAQSIVVQPELAGFPVFVAHGTQDPMIGVERGRESREALLKLGVGLTYREYEMQHEIRPEALRDLLEWLEDKVLQPIRLY
jgi:phospholipase/carboxylesterase